MIEERINSGKVTLSLHINNVFVCVYTSGEGLYLFLAMENISIPVHNVHM